MPRPDGDRTTAHIRVQPPEAFFLAMNAVFGRPSEERPGAARRYANYRYAGVLIHCRDFGESSMQGVVRISLYDGMIGIPASDHGAIERIWRRVDMAMRANVGHDWIWFDRADW